MRRGSVCLRRVPERSERGNAQYRRPHGSLKTCNLACTPAPTKHCTMTAQDQRPNSRALAPPLITVAYSASSREQAARSRLANAEQQLPDTVVDARPLSSEAALTRRRSKRTDTTALERHQPRRPTRPRLPVCPGDAALWRRRPRPPSTVSHELLNSKHKSSSLAGIARTAAFGRGWGVSEDLCGHERKRMPCLLRREIKMLFERVALICVAPAASR